MGLVGDIDLVAVFGFVLCKFLLQGFVFLLIQRCVGVGFEGKLDAGCSAFVAEFGEDCIGGGFTAGLCDDLLELAEGCGLCFGEGLVGLEQDIEPCCLGGFLACACDLADEVGCCVGCSLTDV